LQKEKKKAVHMLVFDRLLFLLTKIVIYHTKNDKKCHTEMSYEIKIASQYSTCDTCRRPVLTWHSCSCTSPCCRVKYDEVRVV